MRNVEVYIVDYIEKIILEDLWGYGRYICGCVLLIVLERIENMELN